MQDAQKGCPARPQRAKRRRRTLRYVEPLSDARTPLAAFLRILLGKNDRLLRITEFFECGFQNINHGRRAAEKNAGGDIGCGKVLLQKFRWSFGLCCLTIQQVAVPRCGGSESSDSLGQLVPTLAGR